MKKILLIDDEKDMLSLIKNILKKNNYEVDAYQSPRDFDESYLSSYDLILLDIMMPDIDGITYCKKIREKVDCPIIFLTAKTMEKDIIEGLVSGADDYILKPFGVGELVARVTAHLRREERERHFYLHFSNISFDLQAMEVFVDEKKIPLTKGEYKICEFLAKNRGQVFSREYIYEKTFGYDGQSDPSAISEHIKNIRAKFQKYDENPVATVWGIGYKRQ